MESLSGRYATELLGLARAEGQLEAFFTHALVMVGRIGQQGLETAPPKLAAFVAQVPGRMRGDVLARFIEAARGLLGPADVVVFAPAALSESQHDAIVRRLSQAMGRPVCLRVRVDRSLIGGLRIVANGQTVDNTIKKQLDTLKKTLYEEVFDHHAG